jgi:hypothetical protein
MTDTARKLLADVLALPEADRAEIATRVLASLDDADAEGWDEAWLAELDRRVSVARTRSEAAPEWRSVRERLLADLHRK